MKRFLTGRLCGRQRSVFSQKELKNFVEALRAKGREVMPSTPILPHHIQRVRVKSYSHKK